MPCKITLETAEARLKESKEKLAGVKSFLERQYTKFGGEDLGLDKSQLEELCLIEKVYVYEKAVARLRGDKRPVPKPNITAGAKEDLRQRILAQQVDLDHMLLSEAEWNVGPFDLNYSEKSAWPFMLNGKEVLVRTDILAKYNSQFATLLRHETLRTMSL